MAMMLTALCLLIGVVEYVRARRDSTAQFGQMRRRVGVLVASLATAVFTVSAGVSQAFAPLPTLAPTGVLNSTAQGSGARAAEPGWELTPLRIDQPRVSVGSGNRTATPGTGADARMFAYDSGSASTTALEFVATKAVRPGTDLVKYEAYPPAATSPRGFVGGPVRDTLQPGTAISRYGGEGGTFASPAGTPFSARGLPPGHEALGESRYVFAQPLEVDAGIAAYWQGGGGGIQYDLPRSISDLVNDGILKRLP